MRGHVFPVLQLILLPVCCTATYVWSVLLGHVDAGFPYISDTGTYPPESCLFGFLLALYSFVTAGSVCIRWQQVRTFCATDWSYGLRSANNISLVFGILASLGVLLVANFQETNVIIVHMIGAFLAFGMGAIYTWFQTIVSYSVHGLPGKHLCVRHFRLALSVFITGCCVMVVVLAKLADQKEDGGKSRWSPSDKGWKEHVASTTLEWVLAFLSTIYFATFFNEFRQFNVAMPVEFKAMEVKSPSGGETVNEVQHVASFKLSSVS